MGNYLLRIHVHPNATGTSRYLGDHPCAAGEGGYATTDRRHVLSIFNEGVDPYPSNHLEIPPSSDQGTGNNNRRRGAVVHAPPAVINRMHVTCMHTCTATCASPSRKQPPA